MSEQSQAQVITMQQHSDVNRHRLRAPDDILWMGKPLPNDPNELKTIILRLCQDAEERRFWSLEDQSFFDDLVWKRARDLNVFDSLMKLFPRKHSLWRRIWDRLIRTVH